MIRTQIFLTEIEQSFLEKKAQQTGLSKSEIVRRVLDEFIKIEDGRPLEERVGRPD
jgi:hypothetical protein